MNEKYKHIGDPFTRVIEECSEVIHIITKIQRFGLHNYHPDDPKRESNKLRLESEMFDLEETIKNLRIHLEDLDSSKER